MDPVKEDDQTWNLWTWMAYWASHSLNLGTWETAVSILAVGLSLREAIPIVSPPPLSIIHSGIMGFTHSNQRVNSDFNHSNKAGDFALIIQNKTTNHVIICF